DDYGTAGADCCVTPVEVAARFRCGGFRVAGIRAALGARDRRFRTAGWRRVDRGPGSGRRGGDGTQREGGCQRGFDACWSDHVRSFLWVDRVMRLVTRVRKPSPGLLLPLPRMPQGR